MNPMTTVSTGAGSETLAPGARPTGCTNLKLRQLMRVVTQRYDVALSGAGLKATQYALLSCVVKSGPLKAVDLANLMRMSPSTLSRNLQPLLAAGWLQTGQGTDARSHLIEATPAGAAKRAEAQRRWRAAQESVNSTLGPERVQTLHRLLDESLALMTA